MDSVEIVGAFDADRDSVVAAMLFPRDGQRRLGYRLRQAIKRSSDARADMLLTPHQQRVILDLPSRSQLENEADAGARRGIVAGDLVALMYDQQDEGASIRKAFANYTAWALGKTYGGDNKKPLKRSQSQLRTYYNAAKPAAHLWAAFRLMPADMRRQKGDKAFDDPEGFGFFLGVAAELQRFLTSYHHPKHHEPLISGGELLLLPEGIAPIAPG